MTQSQNSIESALVALTKLQGKRATAADLAVAIGVSPALISRIRAGKIPVSKTVSEHVADLLERASKSGEIEMRDGHRARTNCNHGIERAHELFTRVARPKAIIAVVYADPPRASASGPYAALRDDAAMAIANGACFAMFLPWDRAALLKQANFIPKPLLNLLDEIGESVVAVYWEIAQKAIDAVWQRDEKVDRKVAAAEVFDRLMLYELAGHSPPGTVLQSRVFFVEIPGFPCLHEVWEWVAVADGDLFVLRDPVSLPPTKFGLQFERVLNWWRDNSRRRLPRKVELCLGDPASATSPAPGNWANWTPSAEVLDRWSADHSLADAPEIK